MDVEWIILVLIGWQIEYRLPEKIGKSPQIIKINAKLH
jgi:hypothetical protein